MKALILRSDADAAVATAQVMIDLGFQISCVESHQIACALVRADSFDVLIADEAADGQLTHALIVAAGCKNPTLSAILMTDRMGASDDARLDAITCLHAVLGTRISAALIGELVIAALDFRAAHAPLQEKGAQAVRARALATNLDAVEAKGSPVDDAAIDADIDALVAALDEVQPRYEPPKACPVAPLEQFNRTTVPTQHIAQVSIIGEGRPIAAAIA